MSELIYSGTLSKEEGTYSLLSKLCVSLSRDRSGSTRPAVAKKMRVCAYEILLHRTPEATPCSEPATSPVSDLLSCYYIRSQNVRNLAEQRSTRDLMDCIEAVQKTKMCAQDNGFECALRFLVALKDEAPVKNMLEVFQPFTLGRLDALLPRLPREEFGSSLPYQYYPPHLFHMPFSFSRLEPPLSKKNTVYTEYTAESFQSNSSHSQSQCIVEGKGLKPFQLPTPLTSQTTFGPAVYSNDSFTTWPRLLAPRDLCIPKTACKPKAELKQHNATLEVEEMFRALPERATCDEHKELDIWELATTIDKNLPADIWDIASKMPEVEERQLITSSSRELSLWKEIYRDRLGGMHVVSEKQFIRHLMYLTIGIESQSFKWSEEHSAFSMRSGLSLEGVSLQSVQGYVAGLLSTGTCYRRLCRLAFSYDQQMKGEGCVFEAAKNCIRRFLLDFRLKVTDIYEECFSVKNKNVNCLPSLLSIMHHVEPLRYEIETVASIYKVIDNEPGSRMPRGAGLMSYLYNEISLITHAATARTMFRSLYSICNVYFKFIERFIFEGELEDLHEEFFIRKDVQYVHSCSKRYWDRGFYIADSAAVPSFLRGLARHILLCGKSFRLLKLCNPNDPLVLLISSDHPSVACCSSFQQMWRQQRMLELYRTRCMFVSGEPVTFDQMMLRKEAERKAFTEMASVRQAETMEKIIAERKRLAQLIVAEKQHNLRVLELAIAETKAAKKRSKQRDAARTELERAVERAQDETDAILRDEEKNKMLEYYTKLNLEVEKRKAHTEWKIRRMQLDSERMQLLSTEERNLKREKLELEHSRNDDGSCTTSIYTDAESIMRDNLDDVMSDMAMAEDNNQEQMGNLEMDTNENDNAQAVCGTSDALNDTVLDSQGNIIPSLDHTTGFTKIHLQAMKNKHNNLAHLIGQIDSENNITDVTDAIDAQKSDTIVKFVDIENNILGEESFESHKASVEAKRNKDIVLGTYSDNITLSKPNIETETELTDVFITDAGAEAIRNKFKILGTDEENFQLTNKLHRTNKLDHVESVANAEAKRNRQKILSTDSENEKIFNRSHSEDYLTENQKAAIANRDKVLGTYSDNIALSKPNTQAETKFNDNYVTDAGTEAIRNKLKILNTEEENFQLTNKLHRTNNLDHVESVANVEARRNKQKILSTNSENQKIFTRSHSIDSLTETQKAALANRDKVLGTYSDNIALSKPNTEAETKFNDNYVTDAGTEAIRNKLKILNTEEENFQLTNKLQRTDNLDNFESVANAEARRNKQKILNADCENQNKFSRSHSIDYLTEAQKEAVANRNKVLGTEYYLEVRTGPKEPLNAAQEEAARNKKKILSSEYGISVSSTPMDLDRRASLKLDLKRPNEIATQRSQERTFLGITPSTGGLTPGDLFGQLHLETPTTADIPLCGPPPTDLLSPANHSRSIFNVSDNGLVSSEGFKFPSVVIEDNIESPDEITVIEQSPSKVLDLHLNKHFNRIKSSIWNRDHSPYNFDNFDPFGVKGANLDSKFHLSSKMDLEMKSSCYSNPADLMLEAQKKPYSDIFSGYSNSEEDPELSFEDTNIATLSACFQRSILLPLSYQLEMVNNSILTYYLVDLDIYEHLRSLKDYFFLMDGEFSSMICQNLFHKLVKTINPEELLNFATLHSILDKALISSVANVNKFSENLSFTITEPPLSFQHSSPDVLQCLSLAYTIGWPANIILSAEALSRYARLFQFLLKMRRISWMLGQDFETLKLTAKLSRDTRCLLRSPQYNRIQLYRHVMASFIRALDNYIVTTCIHSSWTEFEGDMRKARTLDDLHDCHVAYIKKVLFRCLLNKRSTPVMKLLNDIFTVILRFSHVLRTRSWTKNETTKRYTNACFIELQELYHVFEKLARHLHKTITRLMECGYQPHLVELLTMVNLNGYYDPPPKSPNTSLDITQ